MKTSAISKVSMTALDSLIEDIHILLENQVQSLQNELSSIFSQRGVQFDSEITSVFQNVHLTKPFRELNTDYLRKEYYASEMKLLVGLYR